MQVFFHWLYGYDPDGKWDGVEVFFGYDPSAQLAEDALIGFNVWGTRQTVRNANGLKVGPNGGDTDFATTFGIYNETINTVYYTDDDGNEQSYDETVISRSAPTLFTALYDAVADPVEVPEPATLGSMALGVGLLGVMRRRRRSAA